MYYIKTQIAQWLWQSWRDDCLHGNEVLDVFVSEIHAHNYLHYNSDMECIS